MTYWTNLEQDTQWPAEIHAEALEYLSACDEGEYDEIYAGHFLEHLEEWEGRTFMELCYRVLTPGGRLGIVVPDAEQIFHRYLRRSIDSVEVPKGLWWPIADLDAVCGLFIYSSVQESPHRWIYDRLTLAKRFEEAGFIGLRDIDRYRDPRIAAGAWYQFGIQGWKPKETKK